MRIKVVCEIFAWALRFYALSICFDTQYICTYPKPLADIVTELLFAHLTRLCRFLDLEPMLVCTSRKEDRPLRLS